MGGRRGGGGGGALLHFILEKEKKTDRKKSSGSKHFTSWIRRGSDWLSAFKREQELEANSSLAVYFDADHHKLNAIQWFSDTATGSVADKNYNISDCANLVPYPLQILHKLKVGQEELFFYSKNLKA